MLARGVLALLVSIFVTMEASAGKLSPNTAQRVLALLEDVREEAITIGPIRMVEEEIEPGVTLTGGMAVTYLVSKQEDGRFQRLIRNKVLYCDQDWGWHCVFTTQNRAQPRIFIYSEKLGEIVLK